MDELQPYKGFDLKQRIIKIELSPRTKDFYRLNPVGVSIMTHKELMDIAVAIRQAATIYQKAKEDNKLDLEDLKNQAGELIELVKLIKDAVDVEAPIVISELTEDQAEELLTHLIGSVLIVANLKPSPEGSTTYKELKEVIDALDIVTKLFVSVAEDGKITVTDIFTNLGTVIDLTSVIKAAAKIEGKINIADLESGQIQEIINSIYKNFIAIVKASKGLK